MMIISITLEYILEVYRRGRKNKKEESGVRSQESGGGDTSYLQGRSYYPYGGRDKKARNIIGEFICKGR